MGGKGTKPLWTKRSTDKVTRAKTPDHDGAAAMMRARSGSGEAIVVDRKRRGARTSNARDRDA